MSLTLQNIINAWLSNIVAKSQWNDGVSLHSDPYFTSSNNDLTIYNIANNDCVLFNRVNASGDNPFSFGKELVISNLGYASPNLGGFSFEDEVLPEMVIITRFFAKIPVGYQIDYYSGDVGENATSYWFGSNIGTGLFREYINVLVCGNPGSFFKANSFALSGIAGTPESPVTWSLAFANSYDLSASYYQYFQTHQIGESLETTNLKLNKTKLGVDFATKNIIKSFEVQIIDGFKLSDTGERIEDVNYAISNYIPVTPGSKVIVSCYLGVGTSIVGYDDESGSNGEGVIADILLVGNNTLLDNYELDIPIGNLFIRLCTDKAKKAISVSQNAIQEDIRKTNVDVTSIKNNMVSSSQVKTIVITNVLPPIEEQIEGVLYGIFV